MSFTDNCSDEEFIRQMKDLIGNEGDIHVTCNHSEGEQVTETHVHAESSLVTITQNPDSEIWRDSILHSAMHSLMNSQDRDTRDRSLNDDNVLEISEPRI